MSDKEYITKIKIDRRDYYLKDERVSELDKTVSELDKKISGLKEINVENGSGEGSVVQKGTDAIASGLHSFAIGRGTQATGELSYAEGDHTTAKGWASHSEGQETEAAGSYSHAEGYSTKTVEQASHAEGYDTNAEGWASHAEGQRTNAIGSNSHAEGEATTASGINSHAEGHITVAKGYASHASGDCTEANYDHQFVVGKYNENKENTLFEVGNGSENSRGNALEILRDGRVKTYGTPSEDNDLVSKKYVDDKHKDAIEVAQGKIDLTPYAKVTDVPTKLSDLDNDMHFIDSASAVTLYGDQTISGTKEFIGGAIFYGDTQLTQEPSIAYHVVNKKYVDNVLKDKADLVNGLVPYDQLPEILPVVDISINDILDTQTTSVGLGSGEYYTRYNNDFKGIIWNTYHTYYSYHMVVLDITNQRIIIRTPAQHSSDNSTSYIEVIDLATKDDVYTVERNTNNYICNVESHVYEVEANTKAYVDQKIEEAIFKALNTEV